MSKKNNKGTKRKAHDFDLQREKAEAEKRAAKLAKKQNAGVKKVKKNKGVRIRKGVVIKGIKVVDAESKAKVKSVIAKAAKAKAKAKMDIDEAAAPIIKRTKKVKKSSSNSIKQDMMDTQ
ncbi:hypothetical protein Vretimale_11409 [Volvox reticuliferus]|uniref:Uncharacterized protein n=1 Tax=Volvox reticuliferus TaxID=1737510 RepID=A0A8J4CHF7_9CHLO|nr:hypothetical protein Vretifemale_11909 [Volvox reticuliferus]GIM07303.1 hypothetical protein Vretimale_11409 [Volvox reticuliferus]